MATAAFLVMSELYPETPCYASPVMHHEACKPWVTSSHGVGVSPQVRAPRLNVVEVERRTLDRGSMSPSIIDASKTGRLRVYKPTTGFRTTQYIQVRHHCVLECLKTLRRMYISRGHDLSAVL